MKEVCEDFGRRLLRGWDEKAEKEEVKEYVRESVEAFFKRAEGLESKSEGLGIRAKVTVEEITESKKPKKGTSDRVTKAKKSKKASPKEDPAPDSPSGMTDTEEAPKKKTSAKSKGGKPKCEGVTAKGTQCSKCAIDGEVFCSVHLKKKKSKDENETTKTETSSKKSVKGKKKEDAPVHSHEIGEEPEKECEVCEKYGDVFELPEYEEAGDDEKVDPSWGLEEEDFDEDED